MTIPVKAFCRSGFGQFTCKISGAWPEAISGHLFVVGPQHRPQQRHLFVGAAAVVRWDLQAQGDQLQVHSAPLRTWDSFWQRVLPFIWRGGFFPMRSSFLGTAEIANTAVVNLNGRALLTADAGRYWEIDPQSLETITPVGYFDEHVVTAPGLAFPMLMNTAHPFYDPNQQQLISCELRARPRLENFWDMVCRAYLVLWDGQGPLQHWQIDGVELDGCPHSVLVTEGCVLVPDVSFQVGFGTLMGLNIPLPHPHPHTQLHIVDRSELVPEKRTVPGRLVTFPGDSFHFLWNYRHSAEAEMQLCAVQQSTISLVQAIEANDIRHFSGKRYESEYWGLPWMFAFDPGTLRKVRLRLDPQDTRLVSCERLVHPGWWTTMFGTADPREQFSDQGYSAIYQGYAGFTRDLISRRQYLQFRDHPNRLLHDEQLPLADLPSVLARIPLDENWDHLTSELCAERSEHPERPLASLGRAHLDFYVFPDGHLLNAVQFVPQGPGYVFTTVLVAERLEAWLFAAGDLKNGPLARVSLPEGVHFGFMLHSEHFASLDAERQSGYRVRRLQGAVRTLTRLPLRPIKDMLSINWKRLTGRYR